VSGHPAGTFYHLYGWLDIVRRQFGHRTPYLAALDAGRVVGVLPLVYVKSRMFGKILCSVPFMNYGGPCTETEEASIRLLSEAAELTRKLCADYLELRCSMPLATNLPVSRRKVSMTISLDPDPEVLWNRFSSKHRKNVRRAARNGLEVQVGGADLLPEFYSVLERSWRDLGTPIYRRDYFRSVLDAFPDRTRIFVCRHDGRAVSVAFVGFHGQTAEGMWQGGLREARDLDANYVLYWEMIRDVSLRGCRAFHLGRSTVDSGSEWFKTRWNAESKQLHWYFYRPDGGPLPSLNVDNPRYRLAIATWRRMPLCFTRRLGPPLARGIP
jgi:FemAB-related protein (PEP-CTERM system-associated)